MYVVVYKHVTQLCCSDGVSTWAKFDDHNYLPWVSCYMQKYLPFIMYYGSALLLFIRKLHYLQTFEHMSALLAIKAWILMKFHHKVLCIIGMDEVLAHYACTLENSNLHFHFQ